MTNPVHIIVVSLIAYTAAQLIKHSLKWKAGKKSKLFFEDGGFPSAHSSTVTALAVSVLWVEGVSVSFAIAATLAAIVVHDAVHVRGEVNKHAILLNKTKNANLNESVGHTWPEAIAGVALGFIVVVLYGLFF